MYSPSNNFSPRNSPQRFYSSVNQSQSMFSPRNSPQGSYSPRNTLQRPYSPRNASQGSYSPRNTTQGLYSPRSTPQELFSPSNTLQGTSTPLNTPPAMYPRNTSPLHQQAIWNNRRSFNNTSCSSEFQNSRQSFNSSSYFSDSSRGSPYSGNRRQHRQNNSSEKGYNIRDYINPSMLADPWADLEKEMKLQKEIKVNSC